MNISLIIDQPDTVLDEAGFSIVHLCRTYWEQVVATQMVYEPVSETVMLEPKYDAADCLVADYQTNWGTWTEVTAGPLGHKQSILQGEVYPASDPWVQSHKEYARNQGFVLHFYLYEPPPTFIGVAGVTLWFGRRYGLALTADGTGTLYRARDADWKDGQEPPYLYYSPGLCEPVARGAVLDTGARFYNEWHRVVVLPAKSDRIAVLGASGKGFMYVEPDLLRVEQDTEDEGKVTYTYCTCSAPIRVAQSGGAFAFNLSTPTFASAGTLESPLLKLPYVATGDPVSDLKLEPKPGVSGRLTLLQEPRGLPLEMPADQFAYRIDIESEQGEPGYVYDARVQFPANSRVRSPSAVDASAYTMELRENAALDDASARLSAVLDNSGGTFTDKLSRCNMRVELTIDGERRFTGLSGESAVVPGKAAQWRVSAEDLYKKLRNARLSNATAFDGRVHSEVVEELVTGAGVGEGDLVIEGDEYHLPVGTDDRGPLYQPRNGQTVAEFIEYIRRSYSGWDMYFDRHGRFHYEPPPDEAAVVAAFSYTTDPMGLVYPAYRAADEIDESGFANEIYVIGRAAGGKAVTAYYIDYSSQNDPECERYVGERRLLIWVDSALITQEAVNWVCRTLADEATRFRRRIAFEAPFVPTVFPGDAVDLEGVTATVRAMDTVLLPRMSRTVYSVEPV